MCMVRKTRYAVVVGDTLQEVKTTLDATTLANSLDRLSDLFTAMHVPDIEVYVGERLGWRGLYGVEDTTTMYSEVPPRSFATDVLNMLQRCAPQRTEEQHRTDQQVGEVLMEAYRSWYEQRKQVVQRTLRSDDTDPTVAPWVQKMHVLDDVLEWYGTDSMHELFDVLVRRGFSAIQSADVLHLSKSTYHRHLRELKARLGFATVHQLHETGMSLEDFLGVEHTEVYTYAGGTA